MSIVKMLDQWCIPEWRKAHTFWSVRLAAFMAAAAAVYPYLTQVLPYLPSSIPPLWVGIGCFIIVLARVLAQPEVQP